MQPLFWVCKGLVVIGRRGVVEQMRLIICDIEYELRWYFRVKRIEVIFFFKKKVRKGQNLDL